METFYHDVYSLGMLKRRFLMSTRAREVFFKLMSNLGFEQTVERGRTFAKTDLKFDVPTIIFVPVIDGVVGRYHDNVDSVVGDRLQNIAGRNWCRVSNRVNFILDDASKVKRCMKQDVSVMDYYAERNLLIVNFIVKFDYNEPSLSIIKSVCDFIKEILEENNIDIRGTMNPEERKIRQQAIMESKFLAKIDMSINKLKTDVIQTNSDIEVGSRTLVANYAKVHRLNSEGKNLLEFRANFAQKFRKAMDEVKTLHFVKEIVLGSDGINIEVGDVVLEASVNNVKQRIYIGDITLLVTPDDIKVKNKHSVRDYQHPHVKNNNPCLGSFGPKVLKLLGDLDLKRLAFLMYQFLNTYSNSHFISIEEWKKSRVQEGKWDENGNVIIKSKTINTTTTPKRGRPKKIRETAGDNNQNGIH